MGTVEIGRALRDRNLVDVLGIDIFLRIKRVVAGVVDRHALDRQAKLITIIAADLDVAAVEARIVGARLVHAGQQIDELIGIGGRRLLGNGVARHGGTSLGRLLGDHVAAAKILTIDTIARGRRDAIASRAGNINASKIRGRGRQTRLRATIAGWLRRFDDLRDNIIGNGRGPGLLDLLHLDGGRGRSARGGGLRHGRVNGSQRHAGKQGYCENTHAHWITPCEIGLVVDDHAR